MIGRVAFVSTLFPALTDAFLAREWLALRPDGAPIPLFALRRSRDPRAWHLVEKARDRVIPPSRLFSREQVRAVRFWLGSSHRGKVAPALRDLRRLCSGDPGHLAKALAVLPRALVIGWRCEQRSIRHLHAHWATLSATMARFVSCLIDGSYSFTGHAWDIYAPNPTLPGKLSGARFVVTCTRANREHLLRFGADPLRTHVVHHGLDPAAFPPGMRPRTPGFVLSGTSLAEQKGLLDLVDACASLVHRGIAFCCEIVGEGPERQAIERRIRERGLTDRVTLVGSLDHLDFLSKLQEATVFAAPSVLASGGLRDGIPNALLEAMAAGCPVVASDLDTILEVVRDGETGRIVPQRSPERLAAALAETIADPNGAGQRAERARQFVTENFDLRQKAAELRSIFERYLIIDRLR